MINSTNITNIGIALSITRVHGKSLGSSFRRHPMRPRINDTGMVIIRIIRTAKPTKPPNSGLELIEDFIVHIAHPKLVNRIKSPTTENPGAL